MQLRLKQRGIPNSMTRRPVSATFRPTIWSLNSVASRGSSTTTLSVTGSILKTLSGQYLTKLQTEYDSTRSIQQHAHASQRTFSRGGLESWQGSGQQAGELLAYSSFCSFVSLAIRASFSRTSPSGRIVTVDTGFHFACCFEMPL
eukprot:COSAG02_NODE_712_length_18122_cov_6.792321_3_plen_145_part_00